MSDTTPINFDDSVYNDSVSGFSLMSKCNKKYRPTYRDNTKDNQLHEGDVWFIKRDYLPEFFRALPTNSPNITVVTQHSDYEVDDYICSIKPKCVKKVFGPNMTTESHDFVPIPLGLGPPYCQITPKIEDIVKLDTRKNRTGLLYANFRPSTNPKERTPLLEFLASMVSSGKRWITLGKQPSDGRILDNYLSELCSHKFSICPRGNGIDTHRLWEALYCRTIPVVRYCNAHRNFRDLPILFVDSWSDVTEDFLNSKYDEFCSREWDYSKLKASWWEKEFLR